MTPLRIDLVTDIVCPWCFIGTRRLDDLVGRLGEPVEIVHHPFLLDPSIPPEGMDLRERLRTKYGADPEAMFARVEAAAHEAGIPLDFAKVRRTPATEKAHALVAAAAAWGAQQPLALALFEAYFLEGADIGNTRTLVEIAAPFGLSDEEVVAIAESPEARNAVRKAAAELSAQGISGVPFFVFGNRFALSGAQPEAVLEEAMRRARAEEAAE
ncbi:DsbA family protein [Prosthecomicrobium pneumaticum]|uniref:Putative DsbA family dithiol-disulfide isomerase n=1 Tax=Prosthecomicrobium pneumaticum TaxID=81895 RepID=A0A7W9FML4_9HYPH|nr:putative DsbA family dithiol-disulfide isomerase [Prosthecomicrobium pneumaticum]